MKQYFNDKILSRSNSFKHFKNQTKKLTDENDYLKEKIKELTKEKEKYKKQYQETLNTRRYEINATSFCDWSYIDFYYRDDFDEIFSKMLKNLPSESKRQYKLIFIRTLTAIYMNQKTFFSNEEIEYQKRFQEFTKNNVSKSKIGDFNVIKGDYNIHHFMNNDFSIETREFLKNKDIIDAGAYIGDSTLPLSKLTSKKVYAFEPFKESFETMKENIKLNNIKNIIPINASLSNIDGELSLFIAKDNIQGITPNSSIRKYDKEIIVNSRTIDSFVKENGLDVGFIKIDVEGGEKSLLNGAINTIKTQKPILFISIYHSPSDFFEIKPWIESLDLDYEFKINKEQPWTFIADTILECRPKYYDS